MAKQLLNEAELLLAKQWSEARLLEKSMDRVREKYDLLYAQVLDAVGTEHPQLDMRAQYITQQWSKGSLRISRKAWRGSEKSIPSGIYLENIRLETISEEEEPPPLVSIWIHPKTVKAMNTSLVEVRNELFKAAKKAFKPSEYKEHIDPEESNAAALFFKSPTKQEILDLFIAGDEEAFTTTIAGYIDAPARLIPTLDTLLEI